jgi:hypothetical protein
LTGTNADKAFTLLDEFSKKNRDTVNLIVNKSFDNAAEAVIKEAQKD